ncbi:hypothetical protein Ais01nite_64970 [Asanoa ishikariensis]|nr:hypothetical protein Ais01nite_64970 [Asanoa ishikariensis]
MTGGPAPQLRHELDVCAEPQPRVEGFLRRGDAQFFHPAGLQPHGLRQHEPVEDRATPQSQRAQQRVGGGRGPPVGVVTPPVGRQPFEDGGVQLILVDPQQVATAGRDDPLPPRQGRAVQRAPQVRDVRLEVRGRGRGWPLRLRPERVDERVGRHQRVWPQQKNGQKHSGLSPDRSHHPA